MILPQVENGVLSDFQIQVQNSFNFCTLLLIQGKVFPISISLISQVAQHVLVQANVL